jgi:multidrug efflux pump
VSLSAVSNRYPSVVLAAVFIAIAWGTVALVRLPRQEEPALTWRLANVVTLLPGASPERVESLITDVLERNIEQVDDVEHIYSVSRAGVSLVQIELADAVTEAGPVWQKVRHKLSEAQVELPAGTIGPDLDDEIMGTFAVLVAITSPTRSYRELKDQAERLEDQLRFLSTTASTDLFGVQREVIEVEPQPARLAAYDLSFHHIATALHNRNTRQPSGRLRVEQSELLVEASGEFENESDLRDMVLLTTGDGQTVRLGDVATVRRTTVTPPEPLARIDGKNTVVVGARARADLRLDRYGETVRHIIDGFRESLPADYQCLLMHDLSKYTRQRARELGRTLLLSITGVFLSTLLFMGWRGASIVTASIPLTGLIVLILFGLLGVPLNQMSVMAIIMSMGLLVDNAIVVTEQIERSAGEGADWTRIASDEPAKLFMPLLVSTLTTTAAFLPIYLLPGGTGEFVRAIPIGVAVCLLTSLVIAMTVIPPLCRYALSPVSTQDSPSPLHRASRRFNWQPERRYRVVLDWAVDRPVLALVVTSAVMIGGASLGLTLRRDFFSPVQRDQFVIDLFAPQGSALAHTTELVEEVEGILLDEKEIENVGAFVGRNAPLVFYNLISQETYANHYAQLIVRVKDWRDTARVAQRVQQQCRTQVTGGDCVVHILEHGAPFLAPFEVRVSGPSIPALQELGRRTAGLLHDSPGVRNIRSNYGNESLKLVAVVNEPVARAIGIDQQTVAQELRYRLDGLLASHLQEGDERIDILVRFPATGREDIADVRSVYFKPSADQRLIPFSTIAHLDPQWEASSIYRRDGQRTLSLLAYPQFGLTAAQVSKQFASKLDSMAADAPAGYTIQLGGENEQRQEAESNLLRRAIYAIGFFLVLLMVEFRSFRLTGLILVVVPLSLSGTMLGLWLTGWPFNFMAIMGMMIVLGVVINDAVILVDGYQRRKRDGQPLRQRVIDGTLDRTRHVVITTVTTIAGFLPLAISPSLLWPPLAIAIIGGEALATMLTLVVIPAAYTYLQRQ